MIRDAGGCSFAAGADISEFEQRRADAQQIKAYGEIAVRGQRGLVGLSKPLLAMVHSFCVGGGPALALSADVRFATPASRFGITAAKLGLGYEYAGVAALARLVGPSVAKDILFSARLLDADEALRIGLVNFIVDDAQLESEVRAYASRIAGTHRLRNMPSRRRCASSSAIRLTPKALSRSTGWSTAALTATTIARPPRLSRQANPSLPRTLSMHVSELRIDGPVVSITLHPQGLRARCGGLCGIV